MVICHHSIQQQHIFDVRYSFVGSQIYWLVLSNPGSSSNLLIQCANAEDGSNCADLMGETYAILYGTFLDAYDMKLYDGNFYISVKENADFGVEYQIYNVPELTNSPTKLHLGTQQLHLFVQPDYGK